MRLFNLLELIRAGRVLLWRTSMHALMKSGEEQDKGQPPELSAAGQRF
jgi:hypothetical protein